jgi:hypothetical protein
MTKNEKALFRALSKLNRVAVELCDAVDRAEEDIGGSRPLNDIIGDLGPATEEADDVLARFATQN